MRPRERRRADDDDVILDQNLALEISRGGEPPDDRELDAVGADELNDRF